MSRISSRKKSYRRALSLCLALVFILTSTLISYGAVAPLPGPGNPILYEDFNNGGVHRANWANWYNSSGTAAYSKTTVDNRYVGKFAQTPASSSSESQFEPQGSVGSGDYANFFGYQYLTFIMKNPGYPGARIKIEIKDSKATYQLSGGWISIPTDWTTFNFDLTQFPNLDIKKAHLKLILKQTTGVYGEILIDDILATSDYIGTAPTITSTSISPSTANELTTVTFNATYTDADNHPPLNMQLVLDDTTAIDMNEVERGDFIFSDGKQYTYSTKLAVGNHSYYFRAADGSSDPVATTSQNINITNSIQIIDVNDNTTGTEVNQFSYSGSDFTYGSAGTGSYQGDQHYATTTDAYVTFKFIGTNLSLYGAKSPENGIAAISIDGGAELYVDTYAEANHEGALLYSTPALSKGTHTLKVRVTGDKNANSTGTRICVDKINATTYVGNLIDSINVSQAGYNSSDYKVATVTSIEPLSDTSYQVLNGSTVVSSGTMEAEGYIWGKYVYSIDFSSVTQTGTNFSITSNNVSSYAFPIQTNMWSSYKDEMTTFYRLQRLTDTTVAYPAGYSDIAPSTKVFHPDSFLDDGVMKDENGNVLGYYDLSGGWHDAGDYGKYGGNQWVGAEIALAYIRHASSTDVNFDNDFNGIPDLIDEAKFGSEYLLKFVDQFDGAVYDLLRKGGFVHPEKVTDNIVGTADDREIAGLAVGGSVKGAATLAATARAINTALANGKIASDKIAEMQAFATTCQNGAITCYDYASNNLTGSWGSYTASVDSSMFFAETELYLLTGTESYKTSAKARALAFTDAQRSTNYWSMTPMALVEFYPVADASTQTYIKGLLDQQMEYFVTSIDDTAYGTLNDFKNFGVNEPLASYIGDALRYNELFPNPEVLRAALKAMYWIFGNNPWNISWVSGVGSDYVDFLHTRLDEQSYSSSNKGIVLPGAMVAGPNMQNPLDKSSESPWYMDRGLNTDDLDQWRYNEYSVSIQVGLLYSIMSLADTQTTSLGGTNSPEIVVMSPKTEDLVTGELTVFAQPTEAMSSIESNLSGAYTPMTSSDGIYTATINNPDEYYTFKKYYIRGTDLAGKESHSTVQYKIAPPLPDPSHSRVYDSFEGGATSGTFGSQGKGWQNWYTQNGSTTGTFTWKDENKLPLIVDGRNVGKFTHNPSGTNHETRFQPWHDYINVSGYRYLTITMKSPAPTNTLVKISGMSYVSVPTEWTTYTVDMNATSINKLKFQPLVTLKQSVAGYGEVLIDEIAFTNQLSGTAPTITDTSINTLTGDKDTLFTFNATYTDADNEKPFAMQVVVDGVIKDMIELDALDTNYVDGKKYTYSTKLCNGEHSYYFRTTDTTSDVVSTPTQTGLSVGEWTPSVYRLEVENLTVNASTGEQVERISKSEVSGGRFLYFHSDGVNDYIEFSANIPSPGTYNVIVGLRNANDRGIHQLSIDGVNQGTTMDNYWRYILHNTYDLGNITFNTAGDKLIRFTCTDKNSSSSSYTLAVDYIEFTEQQ